MLCYYYVIIYLLPSLCPFKYMLDVFRPCSYLNRILQATGERIRQLGFLSPVSKSRGNIRKKMIIAKQAGRLKCGWWHNLISSKSPWELLVSHLRGDKKAPSHQNTHRSLSFPRNFSARRSQTFEFSALNPKLSALPNLLRPPCLGHLNVKQRL